MTHRTTHAPQSCYQYPHTKIPTETKKTKKRKKRRKGREDKNKGRVKNKMKDKHKVSNSSAR